MSLFLFIFYFLFLNKSVRLSPSFKVEIGQRSDSRSHASSHVVEKLDNVPSKTVTVSMSLCCLGVCQRDRLESVRKKSCHTLRCPYSQPGWLNVGRFAAVLCSCFKHFEPLAEKFALIFLYFLSESVVLSLHNWNIFTGSSSLSG